MTENCIRCKYQDCVSVCPVDCFYAGDPMLVIWLEVNTRFARQWPNITEAAAVPAGADAWNGKANKREVMGHHG